MRNFAPKLDMYAKISLDSSDVMRVESVCSR